MRGRPGKVWFSGQFLLPLSNRNPDGDVGPWCYVYKYMQLTWELCDVPKCCELMLNLNAYGQRSCIIRLVRPIYCLYLAKPAILTTSGPRAPTSNNNKGITASFPVMITVSICSDGFGAW